jgi:hypothetical protein
MFAQYAHDMLIPEKETAEAISNVAAACSIVLPLTAPCGSVFLGTGIYAAGTEAYTGNIRQTLIDMVPMAASSTTSFIFKRAEMVSDALSNAAGVFTGFKTQYWTNKDNLFEEN